MAVNLAAIAESMAVSQLFGHVKGSFTGATTDHAGHFGAADGGTLFLDEVGDASAEVQALLLRALESSEVQPVGARSPRHVDVRVIAATDADLDAAVQDQRFRLPLLHRLAGYRIAIPPLRERRDDIGRLLVHLLTIELSATGELARLTPPDAPATCWLPTSLVSRLARHEWPGNVRELRNVVRQIALLGRGELQVPESRITFSASVAPASAPPEATRIRIEPMALDEGDLLLALRRNRFSPSATAAELGISRTTLFTLMERYPSIRNAADVTASEIARVRLECEGDLDAMAMKLDVSKRGLQLRMKVLSA